LSDTAADEPHSNIPIDDGEEHYAWLAAVLSSLPNSETISYSSTLSMFDVLFYHALLGTGTGHRLSRLLRGNNIQCVLDLLQAPPLPHETMMLTWLRSFLNSSALAGRNLLIGDNGLLRFCHTTGISHLSMLLHGMGFQLLYHLRTMLCTFVYLRITIYESLHRESCPNKTNAAFAVSNGALSMLSCVERQRRVQPPVLMHSTSVHRKTMVNLFILDSNSLYEYLLMPISSFCAACSPFSYSCGIGTYHEQSVSLG
jgi:hypothetical protein